MGTLDRVDRLFESALGRFFSIPTRRLASGPLTFAQMKVLLALNRHDGPTATLGDIARNLNVGYPTATELVNRLVQGGYIRRIPSSADRRQRIVTLSPRGRALMDQFVKRRRQRIARLLGVLEDSEVQNLVRSLETLNGILGKWRKE
jgi:DNA-binding MarR family transcriptional regulator